MITDELMSMMGVKLAPSPRLPPASPTIDSPALSSPDRGFTPETPSSPSALILDKFLESQGSRLKRTSNAARRNNLDAITMADLFSACYLHHPELAERCDDPRKLEYVRGLLDSPEHQALRATTAGNRIGTDVAVERLAEAFANLKKEDAERKPNPNPKKRSLQDQMGLFSAIEQGVKQAKKDVEAMEETMMVIGCGHDAGTSPQLDTDRIATAFKRAKDNAMIRIVCERAGKWIRYALGKQRNKVIHGYDDMVGITVDDDFSKLLASELAHLDDPDLEDEALLRITSKQAMARDFRGYEKVGKGPIVVCVDESSSMSGDNIYNAKAFALAMARVAKHQGRWCCLVGFSSSYDPGTRVVLPPNRWDEGKLLDWVGHFRAGGTDLDVPIKTLPFEWWGEIKAPKGKTDIILITDGEMEAPDHLRIPFLDWKKKEKVRMTGLVLGWNAGELRKVCDDVELIRSISTDEEAISKCLSI